jgi:hypothetical protein
MAAKTLYKEFRCTICFLEDSKCKEFLEKIIHANVKDQYPKILVSIPIHDFRGDFLAVKFDYEKMTSSNII